MKAVIRSCVLALLCVALRAQVTFTPPDGGDVHTGGAVNLKNNDPSDGAVSLLDGQGNVLWTGRLPKAAAGVPGSLDVEIPNSPALVGTDITIKVCTDQGCYSATLHVK
jgi:hypothetical protein